jgi:murein DD-endopeptidase MepM/ murein hydrolase activator NlpD
MRPCNKKYPILFNYGEMYPKGLRHLTKNGKHHGVDYGTPVGTPIENPVYGNIIELGEKKFMGKYVIVKFELLQGLAKSTYRFIAMHLSKHVIAKVMPTTTISKGEVLALSGDTGTFYDGRFHPHCHCQIDKWDRVSKTWSDVDPSFIFGKT